MKAYTLRLDENTLKMLKYISIEEKKCIRDLLLELIQQRIASDSRLTEMLDSEKTWNKELNSVIKILDKCRDEDFFQFIREDRKR